RGIGYALANDYVSAAAVFREAVKVDRTLDPESQNLAVTLNALADTERLLGDFDLAERDYREALRIAWLRDYSEGISTYTANLAVLALDREEWPEAENLARNALAWSEKIGRQQLIAEICGVLAFALVRQGKKTDALSYAERAVEIFTRLRSFHNVDIDEILKECES